MEWMGRGKPALDGAQAERARAQQIGFYALLLLAAALAFLTTRMAERHDAPISGGCVPGQSSPVQQSKKSQRLITLCGREAVEIIQTGDFPKGTRRIDVETAGYPDAAGQSIEYLADDGKQQPLRLPSVGEHWAQSTLFVPPEFQRAPFRLVVRAQSTESGKWSGLSVLGYSRFVLDGKALAGVLVWLVLLHLLMLEAIVLAGRWCAPEMAPLIGMATLGLVAYMAFWAYYASRQVGMAFSSACLLLALAHVAWRTARNMPEGAQRVRRMHELLAPVTVTTALLSVVGFYPFPEHWDTWQYAANRWYALPIDNWLPNILANQVWAGKILNPMVGDWLSSDRPPLQAGFSLLLRPISSRPGWYQVSATWLQLTFLVPVALLLPRLGLQKVRGLALFSVATCALVLFNGIFVWPKLIAATYCLMFYLCMLSVAGSEMSWRDRTLIAGASAALAMLAHGGAVFALAGMALVCLIQNAKGTLRLLLVAGAVSIMVYAPWMAYQKLVDPPGTRLVAWHLAGVESVTHEPLGATIRHAYGQLTPTAWLEGRWANVQTLFSQLAALYPDVLAALFRAPGSEAGIKVQRFSFFYFFYACWFMTPLLWLAMLKKSGAPDAAKEAATLLKALASGLLLWSLLIFTPGQTINHQGAYALNVMAMLASMAAAYRIHRLLFVVLAVLNGWVSIWIFALAPRGSLPEPVVDTLPSPAGDLAYWLALCVLTGATYWSCRKALDASIEPDRRPGNQPLQENHSPACN
jgi:hypothetical protein